MSHPELADFLEVAGDFQLGSLDTERPNPLTKDLSELSRENLPSAVDLLKEVDRRALRLSATKMSDLVPLAEEIRRTIDGGGKVFLCGCGATGRLSISLEIYARRGLLRGATEKNVIGFMAGGDAALIRSIERFEDRPDYGERQLSELGFGGNDLLIASTEGGETPFVIGCAEMAARQSRRSPFFLYCNPDEVLARSAERSRRVLENPSIQKINLSVGPMALSGSTRMQASTVLMAAIGFSMMCSDEPDKIRQKFDAWRDWAVEQCDWSFLSDFIEAESNLYREGGFVLYEPGDFDIAVLTDTTERSPTFTLTPFERVGESEPPSRCFLHISEAWSAYEAWRKILDREPRPLDWGDLRHLTGSEALTRFDFSDAGMEQRKARLNGARQEVFRIGKDRNGRVVWSFLNLHRELEGTENVDELQINLLLKMLLNTHSTLIMGRLGRYEGNLMSYVSANNFKLIDRAIRYVRLLMERDGGGAPSYEDTAHQLLVERSKLQPDEPIVLKTVASLREKMTGSD